jgi:flagellar biosynthesis/type III secretory pathway protein FliH
MELPRVRIRAGLTKLSATEFEEILSITQAYERADATLYQAQAQADELREQYRQEGLALGRQDAQKEALEQIAHMQHSMNNWVKTTDEQLIELVNRCVGEVVNQIDPTLLAKQAVEKGLSELINAPQIHVRIKHNTPEFQLIVEDMIKRYGIGGNVRVLEDGTLKDGDVIEFMI